MASVPPQWPLSLGFYRLLPQRPSDCSGGTAAPLWAHTGKTWQDPPPAFPGLSWDSRATTSSPEIPVCWCFSLQPRSRQPGSAWVVPGPLLSASKQAQQGRRGQARTHLLEPRPVVWAEAGAEAGACG